MKLVVGLGNPGIEYQFTPHNAGFLAIDRLAEVCGVTVVNRRAKRLPRKPVRGRAGCPPRQAGDLHEPQRAFGSRFVVKDPRAGIEPAEDLIILYDELAIPLGQTSHSRTRLGRRAQRGQVDSVVARHRRVHPHPHRRRQTAHGDRPRDQGRRHRLPAGAHAAHDACRNWTKCSTR